MLVRSAPPEILETLFSRLSGTGKVYGPVRQGKAVRFLPLSSISDAELSYQRTVLPPKKFFLPPGETLLTFAGRGEWRVPDEEDERIVLFGLHPCDLHGIEILTVFMSDAVPDSPFLRRREKAFIVGLSCLPDDKCFCRSMGCQTSEKGFDIFITLLGDRVLLRAGSPEGYRLLRMLDGEAREPSREDRERLLNFHRLRNESFTLSLDITDLPEVLDLEEESQVWEELGNRCFTCGNCSIVCPTCSCFNVVDIPSFASGETKRVRTWDSCLFRSYALVAGGHNFREKRAQRVKNRYYHKQKGFVEGFGKPSCVGCGRCISSCPAGIDVVSVFKRLTEAYAK
ncbi:MAG: hydrogenase [Deltaproteobacteria bacterium]|nr:MAG: hydrogenase [Deltaproteobacteria bacterium]